MDRRGFLRMLAAGAGGIALEQAIPLGRVWSFPKEIVIPKELAIGDIIHLRTTSRWFGYDWAWERDEGVITEWSRQNGVWAVQSQRVETP